LIHKQITRGRKEGRGMVGGSSSHEESTRMHKKRSIEKE